MDEESKLPKNLYGSNRPASDDNHEPNVHDTHSPEEVDEADLKRLKEAKTISKKSD
ncbi:MAG TPA: hypothetical protein VGL56_16040 [Fimbriimonadaceae bacterium]